VKNNPVLKLTLFALLAIRSSAAEGPESWKWNDPRELKVPGLRHAEIESASMKRTVGYCIYLPPQYEQEPQRRFPVVFFLHGAGGTESSDAGFARLVHAEVTAGTIAPVIYVFPNGGKTSGYRDWTNANVKSETLIVRELLPHIDREYRTLAKPAARGICGFSMGGGGALRFSLKYPDLFGPAASLAAAIDRSVDAQGGDNAYRHASALPLERRDTLRLLMVVGEDDSLFRVHPPFAQHLSRCGIGYTLVTHARAGHDLGQLTTLSGPDMIRHLARQMAALSAKAGNAVTPAEEKQAGGRDLWPFDTVEAERRQKEAAAASGLLLEQSIVLANGVAVKFRFIPAGGFMMGSPGTEPGHEGDERLHAERIAEPFYMMETQLTVEQYRALMQSGPADMGDGSDAKIPAGIQYRDTVDKVLPALARHAPSGWKVILPDHPRLEYAARAGVATMNPGGDKPEDAEPFAWTRENSGGRVHPVGQKKPNAWGLHDVIGNRWHWFWRAGTGYGNDSTKDHIVYGGTYRAESGGNGARLANIMISDKAEGARFALIRADSPVPKGHPETRQVK
jgi:endo-1,4-beta-xylanase